MCASLIGFLSALILLCFASLACGTDQNQCSRVLASSFKLRWSYGSQQFFMVSPDKGQNGGSPQLIIGNHSAEFNTWCIANSERQTVQIKFGFKQAGTVVEFQNCQINNTKRCTAVCVAVVARKETRMINDKAELVNYVNVVLPNKVDEDNDNVSNTWTTTEKFKTSNSSSPNDNTNAATTSPPSQLFMSSRRKRSKHRLGKRCRAWRVLLKKLAKNFLLEFTQYASQLLDTNHSSLTNLPHQNSKLSLQIDKLRKYDLHWKQATPKCPPYVKNYQFFYDSIRNEDNSKKDEKRFKRDPGIRHSSFSEPYFCGSTSYPGGQYNAGESTNHPSKDMEEFSGQWTASSFPFVVTSSQSKTLLDFTNILSLDAGVLERLEISVQFLPEVTIARRDADQRMTSIGSRSANASSLPYVINDNMTRPYVHNVTIAAAAIGGGFGLLFISVAIVMLCSQKGRRLWFMRSKAQHCECPIVSESENCLSATESMEDQPSVSGINERSWSESEKKTVVDNSIVTLEVKKSNRGGSKARNSSNSSRSNAKSTNKTSNRSTCQHTTAIRGSSRHDPCCIVCQLAGKAHNPVMNAQHYASQVLTSERYTQGPGAVGATLNEMSNRGGTRNDSAGSRNSTTSFPLSIRLPDGEERYRGGRRPEVSLMSDGRPFRGCLRPPPNRTIYSCDPLPFKSGGIMRSATPPSHTPKSHKPLEDLPSGRLPPAYSNDISNGSNNPRTTLRGNNCVCRYLMNHIDDPPPEYSDVMS